MSRCALQAWASTHRYSISYSQTCHSIQLCNLQHWAICCEIHGFEAPKIKLGIQSSHARLQWMPVRKRDYNSCYSLGRLLLDT